MAALAVMAAVPQADSAAAARTAAHVALDQGKIALLVGSDAEVAEAVELSLMWEQDREVMRRKPHITMWATGETLVAREEISLVSSQVVAF